MKGILAQLVANRPLSVYESTKAFDQIMTGRATESQLAALLALIQQRGPSVDEITGAAQVMRAKATKVQVPDGLTVIDTCGTGGDQASTFNISTAAAIVAAAAGRDHGVAVAKHGNRSVTSQSGSSQVLEALGVRLQVAGSVLTDCLARIGMCFCFAPLHHPAMKHAVSVRAELGFRTIFNLLGPLTNPAGARRQVMGVFSADLTEPIAQVLLRLGSHQALVVCGQFGSSALDELSTAGPTRLSLLQDGQVSTSELDAAELGLDRADPGQLQVDSPEQSAQVIRDVVAGQPGLHRQIVCLNAAAALMVADVVKDLAGGLQMAERAG